MLGSEDEETDSELEASHQSEVGEDYYKHRVDYREKGEEEFDDDCYYIETKPKQKAASKPKMKSTDSSMSEGLQERSFSRSMSGSIGDDQEITSPLLDASRAGDAETVLEGKRLLPQALQCGQAGAAPTHSAPRATRRPRQQG